MKAMTLTQVADITAARLVNPEAGLGISELVIDSRKLEKNQAFVALRGENFDGHDFIDQVVEKGASCMITEIESGHEIPQLVVNDSLKALGKIAQFQQQQYDLPTISLTGSCGKTTTKEMLVSILSQTKQVHATKGNLNNEYGVPLTLFELNEQCQCSVIEMGAGKKGDIAYLTALVESDVVLITCIAPAHLEGMGSLEGIAQTKGEIIQGLKPAGTAILPSGKWLPLWKPLVSASQSIRTFGLEDTADYYATDIVFSPEESQFQLHCPKGRALVRLPLLGEHNVVNALAACAAAMCLGASITDCVNGLAAIETTAGRLQMLEGLQGSHILDDSYNANPSAILAGAKVLKQFQGQHILVLGDMAELGEESLALHKSLGEALKSMGFKTLLTVGNQSAHTSESFGEGGLHFISQAALVDFLKPQLTEQHYLLIKGSRSSAMDQVVKALVMNTELQVAAEEAMAC